MRKRAEGREERETTSLVPRPTPSFSSPLYRTKQQRKAGRGPGYEAMKRPRKRLKIENFPTVVPLLFLARTCIVVFL